MPRHRSHSEERFARPDYAYVCDVHLRAQEPDVFTALARPLATGLQKDMPPNRPQPVEPGQLIRTMDDVSAPIAAAVRPKTLTRLVLRNEASAVITRDRAGHRRVTLPNEQEAFIDVARVLRDGTDGRPKDGRFVCPFGLVDKDHPPQPHVCDKDKTCMVLTKTKRTLRDTDKRHLLIIPVEHLPGGDVLNGSQYYNKVLKMKEHGIKVLSQVMVTENIDPSHKFYINCHLFPSRSDAHMHWHILLFKDEVPAHDELCAPVYDYGNGSQFLRGSSKIIEMVSKAQGSQSSEIEIIIRPRGLVLSIDALLDAWRRQRKIGYALKKEPAGFNAEGQPMHEIVLVEQRWSNRRDEKQRIKDGDLTHLTPLPKKPTRRRPQPGV